MKKRNSLVGVSITAALILATTTVSAEEPALPPLGSPSEVMTPLDIAPSASDPIAYYNDRASMVYYDEARQIIGYLHRLDILSQNLYVGAAGSDLDVIKVKKTELLSKIQNILEKIKSKKNTLSAYVKEHNESASAVSRDMKRLSGIESVLSKVIKNSEDLLDLAEKESGSFSEELGMNVLHRTILFLDINTAELEGAIDFTKMPQDSLQSYRIQTVLMNNKLMLSNYAFAQQALSEYLTENNPDSTLDMSSIMKLSDRTEGVLHQEVMALKKLTESEKNTLYSNILANEDSILETSRTYLKKLNEASGKSAVKDWFQAYTFALKPLLEQRKELDQAIALEEGGAGVIINPDAQKNVAGNISGEIKQDDDLSVDNFFR